MLRKTKKYKTRTSAKKDMRMWQGFWNNVFFE